ncbi:MAG: serine hydrolase, partial [Candidatus Binatia bacterium]
MSAGSWAEVADLLEASVGPGRVAPAASLLVGRGREVVFEHCAGVAGPPGPAAQERPVDAATIFDLASLTKPLVTVALTLDLVARGQLALDTVVAEVLPGFGGGGGRRGV